MIEYFSKKYGQIRDQVREDIPAIKNRDSSLGEFYLWFTTKERNLARKVLQLDIILKGEENIKENLSKKRLKCLQGQYSL